VGEDYHRLPTDSTIREPQQRLGCCSTIDGDVKDQKTVNTVNAYTYCLEKSG
jgi:MmpS family membrane protein